MYKTELNPPQREAVEHIEGPLLILAGAGSGKTRVLAYRAAHLVHSGAAPPYRILALTFTNKAAAELKTRAAGKIGNSGDMLAAGTFHSIFARLMRQEGRNIDVDPNYTIIDTDDRRRLIKAICQELGIVKEHQKPAQIEWRISRSKNALLSPETYASNANDPFDQTVAKVFEAYERRIRKMNSMDFDDLLIRPLEAFANYPEFLQRLQERFQYLMVDEYQDTNRAQYLLISNLAAKHRNICVVGDDDQAIYGWRGATVENILEFRADWHDAKIIRLEQNYRSTKPILDVAWMVIKNNRERHPKKLWTERSQGELVEIIRAGTDEEEALRFVGIIDDLHHKDGIPHNEFAILYRTNAQSLQFEQALRAAKLPYHVVGGLKFYDRREVKDVLAYLRIIHNPTDDISLLRILNYPPRGIGKNLVSEIQALSRRRDISIFQAVSELVSDENTTGRQKNVLSDFIGLIKHFHKFTENHRFDELAGEVVNRTGLRERLIAEEGDDPSRAESKIANVDNLLIDISRFADNNPDADLNDFLEEVTLITDADDIDQEKTRVNLLTLHSAKGLEFSVVLIGGLEEGLLPLKAREGRQDDIQEERRLFYVGVTRAKDRLFLGYAVNRRQWGNLIWNGESRFLKEIPDDLQKNPLSKKHIPVRHALFSNAKKSASRGKKTSASTIDPGTFRNGLLVRHPKFGLGVVVSFQDIGQDSRLKVDFDEAGEKTLVLRFAKLTIET